ncbi:hypothetical protein AAW14_06235 [Streptomyces hygroscopicus]|uniref:hypothetical protein n=1 Tax=Streptomyces hygroscopicus TaxID=1912 RepID=UPI00223F76A8|nr:hypothetical protein [Streptomyces hygroscopicus]MCW7941640.1 hypothetical protein [Streptomyces hygroscopicus]
MRTDAILDQIDTALHDYSISGDAMRSAPDQETVAGPRGGRDILVRRLVERHGLEPEDARHAVIAAEQDHTSEHAALVQAEARAVMDETMQRIRDAFRPMAESMAETFKQLAQAFERMRASAAPVPAPGRRTDRPAWQSPYGPAGKKRAGA